MKIDLKVLAKSAFAILAAGAFVLFIIGGSSANKELIDAGIKVTGMVILGSLLIAGMIHGPRWFKRNRT